MRRRGGLGSAARVVLWSLVGLVLTTAAGAIERFPPPEFETAHKLPGTTVPPPRALVLEYLDAAVLLGALALATYLVHKRRSRTGVLWLSLFSLAYFGFYREGCVCAIGSLQNIALALSDRTYHVPWPVLAFFVVPLVFALFYGRTFCSSVCPHGALQDLVVLRPVAVPRWLDKSLGVLAYVYLGAAVLFAATGSTFILCKYDPFIAFFRLTGGADMLVLGAAFLLVGVFVGRPYCRYLCPYGVLLGLAARVSRRRVTIYPDECVQCRLCEHSCPYGALRTPTPEAQTFDRSRERKRLVTFLCLTPVLIAYFGWLGSRASVPLSRSHPTVSLAERVWLEDSGRTQDTTDASDNWRASGQSGDELRAAAGAIANRFARGGWWWGGWIGLVIGLKLLSGTVWRTSTDYEADRATCVACARCFPYCPEMPVRMEALENCGEEAEAGGAQARIGSSPASSSSP